MAEVTNPQIVGSIDAFPKASIGNYKGVMLCNRPNEFGQQRRAEPTGPPPFRSRVDPKTMNPMGWNPCEKVFPRAKKKKDIFSGILNRHKEFLKNLEAQRKIEQQEIEEQKAFELERAQKFKQQASKQRTKIKIMKENQDLIAADEDLMEFEDPTKNIEQLVEEKVAQKDEKNQKLTEENLSKVGSQKSEKAPSAKSKASSKKSKPAWATTEKEMEEQKEAEIDELLEFAYDLDYDKYMDDFEVRQAFAIIQDRVREIKEDQDWKEKIAQEWNQATEAEQA